MSTIDLNVAVNGVLEAYRDGRSGEGYGRAKDLYRVAPDQPLIASLWAGALGQEDEIETALEIALKALAKQDVPEWHASVVGWLIKLNRIDEAYSHSMRAVNPEFARSYAGRMAKAQVLAELGDYAGAIDYTMTAIAANPDEPNGHLHLAQLLLLHGRWEPGWHEYEWRNRMPAALQVPSQVLRTMPWNGMPMPPGSKIVVVGDQGYGDTIQFMRFVPQLKEQFAEVHIGASRELQELLSRTRWSVSSCSPHFNAMPPHNVHVRVTSLGSALRLYDGKWPSEPYLHADPIKVAMWKRKLPAGKPLIGLSWDGRPTHPNNRRRSIRLETMLPLAEFDATYVSIQAEGIPDADKTTFAKFPSILDVSKDIIDFDDTLALFECLDLVVTVDSSRGHLAGAMGKPVWIMIPKTPDWRWMLDRDDSDWYPSARLFRQPTHGDWASVVKRILGELHSWRPRMFTNGLSVVA